MVYLTNVYGARFGASALAANGVLRYMLGGSFPLFALASASHTIALPNDGYENADECLVYNNLGFNWAGSLLGFLAAGFAPVPWLFYWRGARIRESSPYTSYNENE